ncbi:hypothetical protein ABLA30_19585 [Xenorhabdus nematophila]|uniref:ParE family toxin-like protein n=1 Tax=Xenorhabdus nematophila TaxID=628 RepID=UPI00032752D9|nr:hypothetical protein [Xenorhabdus nematophila]CCW28939.1 conserved hypothetical protein [Xenorhabdus nematophila F1]
MSDHNRLMCRTRIPEKIINKATKQLTRFKKGERISTKMKCGGKRGGILKINVGTFWRLLSRDNGRNWELMTHERYNKEIFKQ